jgi:hypothetical protein
MVHLPFFGLGQVWWVVVEVEKASLLTSRRRLGRGRSLRLSLPRISLELRLKATNVIHY